MSGTIERGLSVAAVLVLVCAITTTPRSASHVTAGPIEELPAVNIPAEARQANWSPYGSGSCVHAAMVSLLRWQGRDELAEHWRATYHSGETAFGLASKFEAEGVEFAQVIGYRPDVLDWACRTRRGAGVVVRGGSHMVALVHLDDERAGVLDSNSTDQIKWYSREAFLREWKSSGAWAVTPLYSPPPRVPFLAR